MVLVLGLWLGVLGGFGEPVAARVVDSEPIGAMIETLDFNLYSPNSGGAFDSTGWPPNPSGDLASLRDGGGSSNAPLGQQTDPTTVPPSNADEQRVTDPDAGSLDGALHLFWQKGSALGGVAFDRYLVAWKSGQEEFQTDPIGDRVKVVMGRNIHDVIVEGLANGTEYTVRVTHANSVGPAVHSSREVTATPAERVRELVSNASQNPRLNIRVLFSVRSGSGFHFGVVPFTTGPTADSLGSVTFQRFDPMSVFGRPRNLDFELHLHEEDRDGPGARIGTFVQPPEYVDGPAKFVAPGDGFALAASTTYWLKLVLVEGEAVVLVARRGDEDPTGEPGWLLGGDCWVSSHDQWPYRRKCVVELGASHGPFFMSLNSPIESTLPRASITGSSAVEGQGVEFTIELSSALGEQATVEYSTQDGSGALPAESGDGDYTPVSGATVIFAAGEVSKTISIATGDDSTDETNERFLVRLGNPSSNIVLGELDTAAGVILNNDQTAASDSTLQGLTMTDRRGNAIALNETFDRYRFTYTADAPASADAINLHEIFDSGVDPHSLRYFDAVEQVHEGKKGESADPEFDRVVPGINHFSLLITSNNRRQESLYKFVVTRPASSDASIDELDLQDGNFTDIEISPPFSSSITNYSATVNTTSNNYVEVTPSHARTAASITLNGSVTVRNGGIFSLNVGSNSLVVELTAEDGTIKTYTITLTLDLPLTVKFGQGPFNVDEGTMVSIPVVLNQPAPAALTIPLSRTNQGGAGASDYSVPASVAFAVGDSEKSVNFSAAVDSETDSGEGVLLGFGTLPAEVSAVAPSTATVAIGDVAPTVVNFEQDSYNVAEGDAISVRVRLDSPASGRVDIPLIATGQGGASSADYTLSASTVTVAGGASEGTVTFTAVDDTAFDPGESVRLGLGDLPAGYRAGSTNETTVNISEDDVAQVAVSFGSASYSVDEGSSQAVVVNLSTDPQRTLTIALSRTNQGGASGSDYTLPSTVTFNSGDTTRIVSFVATQDSVDDDGESVRLGFANLPTGVTAGTPSEAEIDIVDDDVPQVAVGFTQAAYSVPEGNDRDIRVVLDRDPERSFQISLTVTPGDADAADFSIAWPDPGRPGELEFDAGVRERTFRFSALADDEDDDGETVAISIDPPAAHRVSVGPVSEVNVTVGGGGGGGSGGGGGGGGGGGRSGPAPSTEDFAWAVEHDIESLNAGKGEPTGLWGDGATLWVAQDGHGPAGGVYAYEFGGGQIEELEFDLAEFNRSPRGIWSDGMGTIWVGDADPVMLLAYDLASGTPLPSRDIALDERNADVRGIWSDGLVMWVLDGDRNAVFAYDLGGGLLAWYRLDPAGGAPQGIWSDGVSVWVSAEGTFPRLYAYRLPGQASLAGARAGSTLERVREEDFWHLGQAGNESPRGIWSDGSLMYVADADDDRVYSYNMPDAIDARLSSLKLGGIEIGAFDPCRTEYQGRSGEGVTEATVDAKAAHDGAKVATHPSDADKEAEGHQIGLAGTEVVTITVTSEDGSRIRVYRVIVESSWLELALGPPWTLLVWPGRDGMGVVDALAAGGLAGTELTIHHWDEGLGTWLSHSSGSGNTPGRNTLEALESGRIYWVATSKPVSLRVPAAPIAGPVN
ncbi:MAG: cadherin-like beta sandwich domain-containing protein [Chloroflexi bacterium]|nr:cadherin-like beta sandwich domain-containing protein [Chloroflexota bacterium]